jgi:hypothetical protein
LSGCSLVAAGCSCGDEAAERAVVRVEPAGGSGGAGGQGGAAGRGGAGGQGAAGGQAAQAAGRRGQWAVRVATAADHRPDGDGIEDALDLVLRSPTPTSSTAPRTAWAPATTARSSRTGGQQDADGDGAGDLCDPALISRRPPSAGWRGADILLVVTGETIAAGATVFCGLTPRPTATAVTAACCDAVDGVGSRPRSRACSRPIRRVQGLGRHCH